MLKELLSVFRSTNPLRRMGERFENMLEIAREMTVTGGDLFFGQRNGAKDRSEVYRQDVRVNKLERGIRKKVVAHLSLPGNRMDVPYCLLLMSLVKDVERIGDYAKNLAEAPDFRTEELPDDDIVRELQEIRSGVEEAFESALEIFSASDHERAVQYIRHGRDLAHRCDTLIQRIARSEHDAAATTALVVGTRYYKRIGGHVLNILSSVVMPLHKIDYYDEDDVNVNDVSAGSER